MPLERRSSERLPADVRIEFHCCEKGCAGKADNISKNGMFIRTGETCFPVNSRFDIFYPTNGRILQIPVRLRRLARSDKQGIGISFVKPLYN